MSGKRWIAWCALAGVLLAGSSAWGLGCWDDQSFFTVSVRPRVILLLDRSGSMAWCFDGSSGCGSGDPNQRLTAAKQAVFGVLDADSNLVVNTLDEAALGVDLAYGYFLDGNVRIPPTYGQPFGTPYSTIWGAVNGATASGGTPCAHTAWDAYNDYVRTVRAADPMRHCRPYYIIMVTDGGSNSDGCTDTYHNDDSRYSGRYLEQNASWTSYCDSLISPYLKGGIKVYWVGLGSTMPQTLINTLNRAAYAGRTDDPTTPNSGEVNFGRLLKGGTDFTFPDCLRPWTPATSGPNPGGECIGFAVGQRGRILRTENEGATWTDVTSGPSNTLRGLSFPIGSQVGWAVGASGTILRTANRCTTWAAQASGTGQTLYSVSFGADILNGVAVGAAGTIVRTANGVNWFGAVSGTSNILYGVYMVDALTGYAVGAGGTILKTVDGGANWAAQASGTTNNLYGVCFVDANIGYAVGVSGTIRKTVNGGTTWTGQTSGTTNNLYAVDFPNKDVRPNYGYVAGASGTIRYTANGGTNWNGATSNTSNSLYSIGFPAARFNMTTTYGDVGYVVGVTGTIQRSGNSNRPGGGNTWSGLASGTTDTLYGVKFPMDNLTGHAFIGSDGARLGNALKTIFKQIQQSGGQTFAMSSLPANFAKGSMYYNANFEPQPAPRWLGHVEAFKFDSLGNPPFDSLGDLITSRRAWDAGNLLRARNIDSDTLTIYTMTGTYHQTILRDYSRVLPETLGFAAGDTTNQRRTVRFVYGETDSSGVTWGWLNDPFHGYTVEIKNPSWIYLLSDPVYRTFRMNYTNRPARAHTMVNDGKLHCFDGDTVGGQNRGGRELWAYVPRYMLKKLSAMRAGHQYTMDGPMVVRHIYATVDSSTQGWQNWRTILIGGYRDGGKGYFALDLTDPLQTTDPFAKAPIGNGKRPYPWPMWEIDTTTTNGPENLNDLANTWSIPSIWKMRIRKPLGGTHRGDTLWVAVMGGGYSCNNTPTKGRFVMVVDAFSGELIRKLSLPNDSIRYGPVAGPVTLCDFDRNGTVDHLFAGDLMGNVWYFDVSDSNPTNWGWYPGNSNSPFFSDPNRRPIFGGIALGAGANPLDTNWIYFGTGDRSNPYVQDNNRFYGIKVAGNGPIPIGQLDNVTGGGACNPVRLGWFINIPNTDTSAVFTLPVAAGLADTVYTLGWRSPSGIATVCSTGSAGTTDLYAFVKTCGNNPNWRRYAAAGLPPTEMPHGIDRKGNHKGVAVNKLIHLESYVRGKIVRSWREVY